MTPRDALQNLIEMIGMTMPMTVRDDNLTQEQIQLRNSVRCLRELIEKSDPTEYRRHVEDRGSGKDRIEAWKREAGH